MSHSYQTRTPADVARYTEQAKRVTPMALARLDEMVQAGRLPEMLDVQVLASLAQLPPEAQQRAADTFASNDLSAVRFYSIFLRTKIARERRRR